MITFTVPGLPQQQGSKTYLGRGISIDANKNLKPWRLDAITCARAAFKEQLVGTIGVAAIFTYPRPRNHYGTGRNSTQLKPSAPAYKTSAPDLDKLCRALGDALTQSGIIRDDALIAYWTAQKVYGTTPSTHVTITELPSGAVEPVIAA